MLLLQISTLIADIISTPISRETNLFSVPLEEMKNWERKDLWKNIQVYNGYRVEDFFFDEITNEQTNLHEMFNKMFYVVGYFDGETGTAIKDEIHSFIVRLVKFKLVLKPDYYRALSTNKTSSNTYEQVKINWINEQGKKYMRVTRSFGKLGLENISPTFIKILEEFYQTEIQVEKEIKMQDKTYYADLFFKYKGMEWVVEIKKTSNVDLIALAVQMELWGYYKADYH